MMFVGSGMGLWFYGVIGLGICVLMVRAAVTVWRRTRASVDHRENRGVPLTDSAEKGGRSWDATVLRLAASKGGYLTVSDLVVASGVTVVEAERILDDIADGVRIRMTVTESGLVRYEFPELRDHAVSEAEEGP